MLGRSPFLCCKKAGLPGFLGTLTLITTIAHTIYRYSTLGCNLGFLGRKAWSNLRCTCGWADRKFSLHSKFRIGKFLSSKATIIFSLFFAQAYGQYALKLKAR